MSLDETHLPVAAMIAAVALATDLPLYTCNPDDFTPIERLEVVHVPHPDT
jgi:tRNA(fMet)-specific endonuclease VapC